MCNKNWKAFFKDEAPRYLDNCFTKNTEFEVEFILNDKGEESIGFNLGILRNVNAMLKPGGRLLMTVLNGYKKIREHSDEDVAKGIFDPVTLKY